MADIKLHFIDPNLLVKLGHIALGKKNKTFKKDLMIKYIIQFLNETDPIELPEVGLVKNLKGQSFNIKNFDTHSLKKLKTICLMENIPMNDKILQIITYYTNKEPQWTNQNPTQ